MHKTLLVLSLYFLSYSPSSFCDPQEDRQIFQAVFEKNLPGIPLEQYTFGSIMLSQDALDQYWSIMDFPPFQETIERGKEIWETPFGNGKTFSDCMKNKGVKIAGNYPKYDPKTGNVVTFEMELNNCRTLNGEVAFKHSDRDTMGALTAYARKLSDGMEMKIQVSGDKALKKYMEGRALYFRRIGQYNLACASCHLTHGGRYFRDELLSPTIGQPVNFPVFRGGDSLYTLQMRYQRCMEAVGAVPFEAGSEDLNNLEYFHSYLSNGLKLNTSVYRR